MTDYHVVNSGKSYASTDRVFMIDHTANLTQVLASLPTSTPNSDGEVAALGSRAYTDDLEHFYMLGFSGWKEV